MNHSDSMVKIMLSRDISATKPKVSGCQKYPCTTYRGVRARKLGISASGCTNFANNHAAYTPRLMKIRFFVMPAKGGKDRVNGREPGMFPIRPDFPLISPLRLTGKGLFLTDGPIRALSFRQRCNGRTAWAGGIAGADPKDDIVLGDGHSK